MIKELFSTPVYSTNINQPEFIQEIQEFILSSMTEENRIKNAPQSAHNDLFESSFDFLNWDSQITRKCKQIIIEKLMYFLRDVTNLDTKALSKFKIYHESWFHVVKQGGYFQAHTHPNASWSVILCVNSGDVEVSNEREAGKLLFIDPRLNASMHLDVANKDLERKYSFNGYRFRPKTGHLYIFPSFLQHSVEPYFGKEPRITVPGNFWFHL